MTSGGRFVGLAPLCCCLQLSGVDVAQVVDASRRHHISADPLSRAAGGARNRGIVCCLLFVGEVLNGGFLRLMIPFSLRP